MELVRLNPDSDRHDFTCGDDDLDESYRQDSIEGANQLISVTYALVDNARTIAFFSVSNDSIKREDLDTKSAFKRFMKRFPFGKRYGSMPAAKIGRLGVCTEFTENETGTQLLDYIKVWFTGGNKTGCRFLIVDAYNNERGLNFYQKNEFEFLTSENEGDKTRIMYFDLIKFRA